MDNHSFYILTLPSEALFKDKGSKFIAFAFPVKNEEEVKLHLLKLKKEHHTANHHCYAYRIGTVTIKTRANDDGEPGNSAGKPILAQLVSNNITNTLIVVVRYFGGTLLGVSGLINAYKNAAAEVIANSTLAIHEIEDHYLVKFDFTLINEAMRVLKLNNARIIQQDTNTGYELTIAVNKPNSDKLVENLKKILNLDITFLFSQ